jgi:hypothetical protein
MSALRYVYGIARASDAARAASAGLTGIDGGRVGCVVEGVLVAAASDVDETSYGETSLNEHVRDLDWLAARAAQHQAVNGRLLELLGTVLPLSFGAIYRDDERVRLMLREDAAERAAQLASLAGRAEWVVTVTRDADTSFDDAEVRALDAQIAASPPGRSSWTSSAARRSPAPASDATTRRPRRRSLDWKASPSAPTASRSRPGAPTRSPCARRSSSRATARQRW